MPQRVCQHACISHLLTTSAHGLGGDAVFPACAVDVCRSVARAKPEKCRAVRAEPCKRIAVEVHSRRLALCVRRVCSEPAVARRARAAGEQSRGAPVAASALAGNSQGRFVGDADCLRLLLRVLLASAHERPRSDGGWPSGARPAPAAFASFAVSARSVLGAHLREAADVYSRARVSARCMVLLSGDLCSEISSWVSGFADFVSSCCGRDEADRAFQRSQHELRRIGGLFG